MHPQYDLITASLVLHWLAPHERMTALQRIRRALRPGGRFYAIVPLPGSTPQWQALTGLTLPSAPADRHAPLLGVHMLQYHHANPSSFMAQLRATGTATHDGAPLPPSRLRQLLQCQHPLQVTFRIGVLSQTAPTSPPTSAPSRKASDRAQCHTAYRL